MEIRFFAERGSADHFGPWAEAIKANGHEAGLASLDGHGGKPEHDYDWDDICRFDVSKQPADAERIRSRARGVAAYVEQSLMQRPDAAVVWGHATTAQRAAAAACRHAGVPLVFSELGWFQRPGAGQQRTTFFDAVGLHDARTELSQEWWDRRLTAEEDDELNEYVGWWKRTRSSKHPQHEEGLPQDFGAVDRPVLLVLLQLDADSAQFYSDGITSQQGVMDAVRRAEPQDWRVLVKEHPSGHRTAEPKAGETWVRTANLHDCLRAAACVVTANSNAGLEALLYEKPVICLAEAPYGRLGFTRDARDGRELACTLAAVRETKSPHVQDRFLRALLHYIIFHYCLLPAEADRLVGKIRERVM